MWSSVTCEVCGLRYRDFRAPDQPDFRAAKEVMLLTAQEMARAGDYSKPARRAAVLGYMHQWKREHWEEHVYGCEAEEYERIMAGEKG